MPKLRAIKTEAHTIVRSPRSLLDQAIAEAKKNRTLTESVSVRTEVGSVRTEVVVKRKPKPKTKVLALAKTPSFRLAGERYYFAYGANLNISNMQLRCPDAKLVCGLRMPGARLIFRGVADIELTNEGEDWIEGGLWKLSTADEVRLDRYEGAGSLYHKHVFPVRTNNGETHDCLIYKMEERGVMPPSELYYDTISQGYRDFGLDLNRLRGALEHSWDDKNRTELLTKRYERKGRPPLAGMRRKKTVLLPPLVLPASAIKVLPDDVIHALQERARETAEAESEAIGTEADTAIVDEGEQKQPAPETDNEGLIKGQ